MTYKARFVHGNRYFNLDAGEFDLFQDFVFPASNESLNATSSPAGSMTGGAVISKTAQDRWWAWSVRIQGTSNAHTHMAARRLSAWLAGALSDKTDKLYFEYTPNYVVPTPIWGQHGAPYRWEVKAAIVDIDGSYYEATIPDTLLIVPISLYVGPYALGARQRLAQAKGGIIEDVIGTIDGVPRGTIIAGATTNKMTNPIFGHATALNGWTAGADIVAVANTDANYILWGSASAKVTRVSAGANYTFAQSITAGNTNAHYLQAYVKAYDGSAITASVVNLFYYTSISTTYTAMGNGWYRLSAAVTGDVLGRYTGVLVSALNTPIYVAGVQLAEQADVSPMTHGDMIGCSWSGTAHASTSVRAVGYARIPTAGILSAGGGSIRLAVKHMAAAAGHSYDRILFSDGVLTAYLKATNAEYYFSDGTNIISGGAAQTFTSGEIQVLHFVWGSAGLKTYLNGALYDSGATFTPWTVGDYLYIGSNATPLGHFNGTFLDFAIFDQPLTTAQVAADYANISPHVRGGDGQRLSSIPYLWTLGGDNLVTFHTDATHNHWAVAAGIQGSLEAETEVRGTVTSTDYYMRLYLSNLAVRKYYDPGTFFEDQSGTATTATDVGSAVHTTSLSTSGVTLLSNTLTWTQSNFPELAGKSFLIIARVKDGVGSNYLRIKSRIITGSKALEGDYSRPYATSNTTTYNLATPKIAILNAERVPGDYLGDVTYTVDLYGYRNTGTNNLLVDYIALFPDNVLYIQSTGTIKTFTLNGRTCFGYDPTPTYAGEYIVIGNPIDFSPNRYNILQALMGTNILDPSVIADTLTYDIYYTPRYLIL